MVLAYFSDRLRHRWLFSVVPALLSITGYAILTTYPKSVNVKYGSLFLAATGAFAFSRRFTFPRALIMRVIQARSRRCQSSSDGSTPTLPDTSAAP